jgi:urea transport system substrate-binding protein
MQLSTTAKYTLSGISFGLAFPLLAWTLDIFLSGLTLSPATLVLIHQNSPIHYIVDLAPFVLGTVFYFLGTAYQLALSPSHYSSLIEEDRVGETTIGFNLTISILVVAVILIFLGIISRYEQQTTDHNVPIKVGILHSLTGTMAISEKSVVDATQMAIDEINASGGLLGRQLESVLIDGKSDGPSFASGAETLIKQEKVSVIFGCWTSASRKEVKPVVERYDHLLFYPVQYEGLEQSHNIIYTGATPNQQISPAVKWSTEHLGKRVYLAASDYVFPRAANTLIKKQLTALGAEILGEYYLPLGSQAVAEMMDDIADSKADVILNTINGDSNLAFFGQLHSRGIETPVMSFSIAEDELQQMDLEVMVGHYSAWNYFQSLDTPENQRFVANFKKRFGADRTTNASMEAAYLGVHLWVKAVMHANTIDTSTVRQTLKGESYLAPEGNVTISALNNHLWKPLHIGQVEADGQFKIVWSQTEPIRPLPYPSYRTRQSWQHYLDSLYKGWGNSWAAPISDHQDNEVAL